MGSRTKKISGYGYSNMFKEGDNTFTGNLIRTINATGTNDPAVIGPAILNINKTLNYDVFKKLDGAVISDGVYVKIDMAAAAALVKDPDMKSITGTGSNADANMIANIWAQKGDPVWNPCDGGHHYWPEGYIDHVAINGAATFIARFKDCSGNITELTYKLMDRTGTVIEYVRNDDSSHSVVIPSDRIETDGGKTGVTFLSVVLKANGVVIDDRNTKVMKAKFGIPPKTPNIKDEDDDDPGDPGETLEDLMDDPEAKHIWFTYSAEYDGDYKTVIDSTLKNGPYKFEAHGMKFEMKKDALHNLTSNSDYESEDYFMYINGKKQPVDKDNDQLKQYFIPLEWLRDDRKLYEKYNDLENCLKLWVFKEQKIKLKWYQTGLFRIFTFVAALVFGGPMAIITMIGTMALSKLLGPELSAIAAIAMAFINPASLSTATFTATVNTFMYVANLASNAMTLYFQNQFDKYQSRIDRRKDEMDEMQDELDAMRGENLYVGFTREVDSLYEASYEALYDVYTYAFDMGRLIQLPKTL